MRSATINSGPTSEDVWELCGFALKSYFEVMKHEDVYNENPWIQKITTSIIVVPATHNKHVKYSSLFIMNTIV